MTGFGHKFQTFTAIALLLLATMSLSSGPARAQATAEAAPAQSSEAQTIPASDKTGSRTSTASDEEDLDNQKFRVEVKEVQIPFSVFDKKGNMVLDLQKEDFQIFEDGVQQEIRYFSGPANLPLRFGLLLDTSSSARPRLKFEKEAAMQLGYYVLTDNNQPTKDHLGFIMRFDRTPEILQDFTASPDDLTTALDGLEAGGGTALLDAIIEACEKRLMLSPGPGIPRRVLVIFSDGEDNLSKHSLQQTIEVALRTEVRIFVVSANGYGQQAPGEETLKRLVEETGGRLYSPLEELPSAAFATGYISKHQLYESQNSVYTPGTGQYTSELAVALTKALEAIGDELTHQYAIGYIPKGHGLDGKFHSIEVRARRKGVDIRVKKGYYANP
ncbi:MAG: VWA domain-containing protein [Acidobacteria bacterium]|nr:VWA domain-containing protein [Acidobacteriota bacterium]